MATTIDELKARLEDDEATFTAAEVRRLVEFEVHATVNDAYNTARLANALQLSHQRLEDSRAQWRELMESLEPYQPPVLQVIGGATDGQA